MPGINGAGGQFSILRPRLQAGQASFSRAKNFRSAACDVPTSRLLGMDGSVPYIVRNAGSPAPKAADDLRPFYEKSHFLDADSLSGGYVRAGWKGTDGRTETVYIHSRYRS